MYKFYFLSFANMHRITVTIVRDGRVVDKVDYDGQSRWSAMCRLMAEAPNAVVMAFYQVLERQLWDKCALVTREQ